jgi:hypothetical protein
MSAVSNSRRPDARDGSPRWRTFVLPLAWAVGAGAVAWAGFLEDPYLGRASRLEAPVDYPLEPVVGLVALMAGHAGLLQAILRPASYRLSWGRAVVAWVLALGLLFAMAMASIHAPPFLLACLRWLTAVAVGTTVLLFASAMRAWRTRRSGR